MTINNRPLYLVTDALNYSESDFLKRIEAACQGGVDLVQLREKDLTSLQYFQRAYAVKQITDKYHIPLLIDDRLDIAQAVKAAGVHLGQQDLPVAIARQILGPDAIIGATAKTLDQAYAAVEQGADYLGVGAIFPTTTHVETVRTSVTMLAAIKQAVDIPVYAIGGLNVNNVEAVKPASVDGVAVVSAIMKADDPLTATQQLRQKVTAITH
ncbi:thiamine phosphate synthase [Lactobacillus sp. LC28-10]|uniref:Thiamine-phosphate synthase n=1 Tax=Secundilactobacillus angelensis TaxID=2722706 RepID=A0ABX1KW78_9LACO|nr:thiamine phosphate synthase [Secundilactobacillus angelensis]MCH5461304.1 thiamine phosphate synthase [Secundilactobacillus angelensis]NLR17500.1 thiamine phosphate synthase [Secundilactobacillus angelensis]